MKIILDESTGDALAETVFCDNPHGRVFFEVSTSGEFADPEHQMYWFSGTLKFTGSIDPEDADNADLPELTNGKYISGGTGALTSITLAATVTSGTRALVVFEQAPLVIVPKFTFGAIQPGDTWRVQLRTWGG